MAWDADSLNKIAGALNGAYSPDQVFRALNFTGHTERECGEHRTTGPRAWCHECCEWCYPEEPCKGCELPQLRAHLALLNNPRRVKALEMVAEAARAHVAWLENHARLDALIAALAALGATDDRTDR
jgi:hypothetical protein